MKELEKHQQTIGVQKMNDREERMNELRKAKGLKPIKKLTVEDIKPIIEKVEKSAIEEFLDKPKEEKKKKPSKKKEIISETKEEINTDNLFEANPKPLNKEEVKEELLNE